LAVVRFSEISTLPNGDIYIVGSFWFADASHTAGLPADLTNDFIIRPASDMAAANIPAHCRRVMRGYLARALANEYRGDHTGDATKPFSIRNVPVNKLPSTIQRSTRDENNVLRRSGLRDLVGVAETL
jgi:hypothetical protein